MRSNSSKQGLFITLEGTEGVGKTTNLTFIREWLTQHDLAPLVTREPGGTALAESIRALLLTPEHKGMPAASELLLMFAARADHIHRVIQPALSTGQCVLGDRFIDASYAYQGGGRQLDVNRIAWLENWILADLRPNLTILLDAPTELGLARADARAERDRFEQEAAEFHSRVRNGYLQRAAAEPERFSIIDASQPLAAVQADIGSALKHFLENSNYLGEFTDDSAT